MTVIETTTFRLAAGADEDAFLAADERVQADFAYQQEGMLRRTTARGDEGWIVIELFWSAEAADAAARQRDSDPAVATFMELVDPASVQTRRYTAL